MQKRMHTREGRVIIDGYNALNKIPGIIQHRAVSLEEQRVRLFLFLAAWKREHSFSGSMVVVFDGQGDTRSGRPLQYTHGISCIYTDAGEEADDRIISIVRAAESPESITVISDDNYVSNNCRALGAFVKPVSALCPLKSKQRIPRAPVGKCIDPATAQAITRHMKKVWNIS